jgi:hypothetical protein
MTNNIRTPKNNQPPWLRWVLIGGAAAALAAAAALYPAAAVPLGLGLAALQLLRHNGRGE